MEGILSASVNMWKEAVLVCSSSSKGRMCVAGKDIEKGSVILLEVPTAYAPQDDGSNPQEKLTSSSIGYSYSVIEKSMMNAAYKATGERFKGSASLLAARVLTNSINNQIVSDGVQLLCHRSSRSFKEQENMKVSAEIVRRLIRNKIDVSLEKCIEILEKLESNAFTVVDNDLSSIAGIGLYTTAAAINHSCEPNCCQTFNSSVTLCIRAITNIKKGEEITIAYIDIGRPTFWRQNELLLSYGFSCTCRRCCLRDFSDSYNCSIRDCEGRCEKLEKDVYISWKALSDDSKSMMSVNTSSILSLSIPYGDVLLRNYPDNFHSFPTPILLKSSPSTAVCSGPSLPSSDTSNPLKDFRQTNTSKEIRFQCNLCHTVINGETIVKKVAKICRDAKKLRKDLEAGIIDIPKGDQCIKDLIELIPKSHYSIVEMYRVFLLESFISTNDYILYVETVRKSQYLSHLYFCYPNGHPFPAIQELIYSKCLLQICTSKNDYYELNTHLNHALKILIISHGEDSLLIRNIREIYQSINY